MKNFQARFVKVVPTSKQSRIRKFDGMTHAFYFDVYDFGRLKVYGWDDNPNMAADLLEDYLRGKTGTMKKLKVQNLEGWDS